MKTFAILAGLVATVYAQAGCVSSAQSLVPSCAQSCLLSAKSAIGCTVETDFACACSSSSALQNNQALTACVLSACNNNVQTALAASSGAEQICSCVATAAPAGGAGPTTSAGGSAPAPSSTSAGGGAAGPERRCGRRWPLPRTGYEDGAYDDYDLSR